MIARLLKKLKHFVAYFYNYKGVMRDDNGKVIQDIKRRMHSKRITEGIAAGKIYHAGKGKPVCLQRQTQGRVSVIKYEKQ